jgi:hypothetical protein
LESSICPSFSPPFLHFFFGFILLLPFLSRSSPSGATAVTGVAAVDAVVRVALGPAPVSEPRTLEGVLEDVVEFEGEPEVALQVVPKVDQEEAPAEGATIAVHMAVAPPPFRGARAPLSSAPRRAAASGAAASEGMEVVLGHPTAYTPGDIFVSEAMSMAHQALSQAQHVLHHEDQDLADERCRLQLWASMLKRTTISERVPAWARQHGFDLQVEAISRGSGQRCQQARGGACCACTTSQPAGAGGGKAGGATAGAGVVERHHPPVRARGPEHPRDQPRPP